MSDLPLHRVASGGAASGQALVWNGAEWAPAAVTDAGAVPKSLVDAKGDLLVGTADNTVSRLSAGTNGHVLTADSTVAEGVKWAAAAGGGSLTVQDENANVSTAVTQIDFQGAGVTATAGTGEVIVTIPGGSGSSSNGPDGKPTLHTPPSSPNAKDDEFNDTTGMSGPVNGLDAQWSKRNLATASWLVLDDTKAPGAVLFDVPTGQTTDQLLHQPVPAGDFEAYARLQLGEASDRQMWALVIVDSSGNGVGTVLDDPGGDGTTRLRAISAWQQSTSLATVSTTVNNLWVSGVPVVLTLRKASGVYYAGVALGDRLLPSVVKEASGTPTAFTPAYVGVGRVFGTGTGRVALDYFRIT